MSKKTETIVNGTNASGQPSLLPVPLVGIPLVGRRDVVVNALLGIAVIPIASLFATTARAAAAPLSEQDPQAKALGYVGDANKVDVKSNPTFKSGQNCANCLQITGNTGEAYRPCNLFPGKTVAAAGWCKAWVKKG